MKITLFLFIYLIVFSFEAIAQTKINTTILDAATHQPIPYTSIFITNIKTGSYADDKGIVNFTVIQNINQDSAIFSVVGYKSFKIIINQLPQIIKLEQDILQIQEVTVLNNNKERFIKQEFGNFNGKKFGTHLMPVGSQLVVYVENLEKRLGYLEQLHFIFSKHIKKGQERHSSKIRIRVYSIDKYTQKPHQDLLPEPIVVEISPRQKQLKVDISKYVIPFSKEGTFVGIEILGNLDENKNLIPYKYQEFAQPYPASIKKSEINSTAWFSFGDNKWYKNKSADKVMFGLSALFYEEN